MTTATSADRSGTALGPVAPRRRGRPAHVGPGGAALGKETSRPARQVAALVLEVLAGARTPAQAAQALAVSLGRYYQWECRALRGLLAACEPQPPGRAASADKEVAALRRDKQRLEREVLRQQALVRAAQRAVGLPPPPAPRPGKKVRVRRQVRALQIAARLQREEADGPPSAAPAAGG